MTEIKKESINLSSMEDGAVTFLDVLGWKGIWEKNDIAINSLVSLIEVIRTEANRQDTEFAAKYPEMRGITTQVKSISDTIAIFTHGRPEYALEIHGILCEKAICKSIQDKIPLRGATSYGRFNVHENIMVGPAVDESASWHEVADWIGVIQTPSALFICPNIKETSIWVYHDVHIKGLGKTMTRCVNWCDEWSRTSDKRELLDNFYRMGPLIPNISPKYTNTLDFYNKFYKEKNISVSILENLNNDDFFYQNKGVEELLSVLSSSSSVLECEVAKDIGERLYIIAPVRNKIGYGGSNSALSFLSDLPTRYNIVPIDMLLALMKGVVQNNFHKTWVFKKIIDTLPNLDFSSSSLILKLAIDILVSKEQIICVSKEEFETFIFKPIDSKVSVAEPAIKSLYETIKKLLNDKITYF